VVYVNVHVAVVPVAVVPGRSPKGAPGETDTEGNQWRRVNIVGIPRIINCWWITGNIDNRGICRYNLNDLLGHGDHLRHIGLEHDGVGDYNDLLRCGFQISCVVRFLSQLLDGVH
jgi:hypothetical protein